MKKHLVIALVIMLAVSLSVPLAASAAPPKSFCFTVGTLQFSLGTSKIKPAVKTKDSLGKVKNFAVAGSVSVPTAASGMVGKVSGSGTVRVSGPDQVFIFSVTGGGPELNKAGEPYLLVSAWGFIDLSTGQGVGEVFLVGDFGSVDSGGVVIDTTTPCSSIIVLEEPAQLLERLEEAPESNAAFEEFLEKLK